MPKKNPNEMTPDERTRYRDAVVGVRRRGRNRTDLLDGSAYYITEYRDGFMFHAFSGHSLHASQIEICRSRERAEQHAERFVALRERRAGHRLKD